MSSTEPLPPDKKEKTAVTGWRRPVAIFLQKCVYWLAKYWYGLFMAGAIIFLTSGLLAPALKAEGNDGAATAVYHILAFNNHQLPERSYFLFGEGDLFHSYSIEELLAFGADPERWQSFTGNAEIGYKTGLNQRMMAIFVGIILGGLIWGVRKGRPRLSIFQFIAMSLPLLIDGFSHMFSENGSGFRETNEWFMAISGNLFTAVFYTGTTVGSLNWWLRTLTGLLFGLGLVWFAFPRFSGYFKKQRNQLEPRLHRLRRGT